MRNFLKIEERIELMSCHKKERDKRVCDRIKAVLMRDDGYSFSEIGKELLLDDETARRHLEDYLSERKLKPKNGGSESKLNTNETAELIAHLGEVTYLYVKDICAYVKRRYGKKYSISGMTKWLHQNNFCYKKAQGIPAKAEAKTQKKFITFYEKLKVEAEAKGEPIYFADSVHPEHQTKLSYGWIPKGVRKEIATTGRQKRLNFMGGICLNGHRIVYEQAEKNVNANSIASFLVTLRKLHPDKCFIHLIWDRAGYHRDKNLQEFAKNLATRSFNPRRAT